MTKTKEERVIDKSFEKLEELNLLYKDEKVSNDYKELLIKYIKLVKKYDKTLKINDSIGKKLMSNNFKLQDKLNYSIDYARNKLLYNITEHKKTKKSLNFYEYRAKVLEQELVRRKNFSFIERLEKVETFVSKEIKSDEIINIDPTKNINISKTIDDFSKNVNYENLHIIKIDIENFVFLCSMLKEKKRLSEFLLAIYKYLKNSFHGEDIIIHLYNEKFCIISVDFTTDKLNKKLEILNTKRIILGFTPTFLTQIVKYKKNESTILFEKRSDILIKTDK